MFRSLVQCHRDGLHVAKTRRLLLINARRSDFVQVSALAMDEQAQHWLGWRPADLVARPASPLARPLSDPDGVLTPDLNHLALVAIERATSVVVGDVSVVARPDGRHDVGGVVRLGYRGRGYGREMLTKACALLHRHFGVAELVAGCEVANTASARWLASCGFVRADGPARHPLPNGRVIDSLWWTHTDPAARSACPWAWSGHPAEAAAVPEPTPAAGPA